MIRERRDRQWREANERVESGEWRVASSVVNNTHLLTKHNPFEIERVVLYEEVALRATRYFPLATRYS